MSFLKKERILRNMKLNDKKLPWVNALNDMGQDLLEKRAQYVAKNNELMQEFHYAHRSTKTTLNNVFNTHFYGAPLWDLFSDSFGRLEKTKAITFFTT